MRVMILGAGGLGSVIGGYLAEAGVETTLVAREAHAKAVNDKGLKVEGRRGEMLIKDNLDAVVDPNDAQGEYDYMILAVKSKDTASALKTADGIRDRLKCVCSVQNNIVKEGELADWIGQEKVLGASTIEGATLEGPGFVMNHMTVNTTAYFGELNGTVSPRAEAITEAFNKAQLVTQAVPYIQQVLWEKLTQIANASTWSVSSLAGNPELTFVDGMCIREGAEHYVRIARELLSVYTALGYEPQNFYAPISRLKELHAIKDDEEAVQTMLGFAARMREQGYRGRTSMHDDVLRGRKTEADWIIKPFIDKAPELGLEVPTITACYRIIKVLDEHLQ